MANDERAARLKAALRENLKRRKAQSRGRAAPADAPAQPPSAGDGDGSPPAPEKGHGSRTRSQCAGHGLPQPWRTGEHAQGFSPWTAS